MEEKFAFLCATWLFDSWKLYLHGRNIMSSLSMTHPLPEMILLNTNVDGQMYFYQVQRLTEFVGTMDILLILGSSAGRVIRVVWRLCAKQWAAAKGKNYKIIPYLHIVSYMYGELSLHKLLFSVLSWEVAWTMRGLRVSKRDDTVWDIVEWILLDLWCLCTLGLYYGMMVVPSIWFLTAPVIVTFGGCLFFVGLLIFDDIGGHLSIGNDRALLQYEANASQLGFLPENMLVVDRDCFDVKYYDLMVFDWIFRWLFKVDSDGFLFIDDRVTGLPAELVSALITQELGQWHYRRSWFHYALPFLRTVTLGVFLITMNDNQTINRWFSFPKDDPPDPIIPMMIAYQWIWPYVSDLFHFAHSWFRWWTVYATDEFACRNGRQTDLIVALWTIAGTSENYPIFDSWYSAWVLGCPTVQSRIANVENIAKRLDGQSSTDRALLSSWLRGNLRRYYSQ